MKCRICRANVDDLNVCQPFGPGEKPAFVRDGYHYRGFPTIRVCDGCKVCIEQGEQISITYKGQQLTINKKQQATPIVNTVVTPDDVLRELRILVRYPVVYDEVQGADFFECPFCEEEGLFAVGNGGICHNTDCAVALAARITNPAKNFFDQIAYKSILHQLSQLNKYPEMRHAETNQWFPCCPFCHQFNQGQGITHTSECIVVYAKQYAIFLNETPGLLPGSGEVQL